MTDQSPNDPRKESHRHWDPVEIAKRRAGWEVSLNTARTREEPERWNGVDR